MDERAECVRLSAFVLGKQDGKLVILGLITIIKSFDLFLAWALLERRWSWRKRGFGRGWARSESCGTLTSSSCSTWKRAMLSRT